MHRQTVLLALAVGPLACFPPAANAKARAADMHEAVSVPITADAPTNIYFPPPGNTITVHDRRSPTELGLEEGIVPSLRQLMHDEPYRRGSRNYPARWALWRHGYLVHVEGDFLRKADVASLRKTWHAMTVGAAIRQGKIPSLDEPISKYQTELKGHDADATWWHVLTQSAAFDYPRGEYPDFKPGEMWTYSDYNPHHLTDALAKVYGQSGFFDHYETVLDEAYFDAIGMRGWHTRNVLDRAESGLWDGARIVISMEHMGRLGLLALARGRWAGRELVPKWFVEQLETKQTRGMLSNRNAPYGDPDARRNLAQETTEVPYGLLTWVNTDGDLHPGADRHWASGRGAGGSLVLWNHTNGLVFVGFGIQPDKIPNQLEAAIRGPNPMLDVAPLPRVGQWDLFEDWVKRNSDGKSRPALKLSARFTGPDGSLHRLRGYRAESGLWKVRFMPHLPGTWTYESEFSDGANGPSGKFLCVESEYTDRDESP
ncbi:MAG: serine hydrolase [Planctomycetota bacterium]